MSAPAALTRPIAAPSWFVATAPLRPGPAPMLQWIQIAQLVVDDSFQRPIAGRGRANVATIAQHFDWSKFAPLIVAPIEGGLYSVIDGQHRATAAAARGIEQLPCMVVIADRLVQAAAFTAINAGATRVTEIQLHRARLAAGDPEANALDEACRAAGVTIAYPQSLKDTKPGSSQAALTLAACLNGYGRDLLVMALKCVTESRNNQPRMLTTPMIKALCMVLDSRRDWQEKGEDLFRAFDHVSLGKLAEQSKREAAETHGRGDRAQEILARLIREALKPHLGALDPRLFAPPPRRAG